MSGVLRDRPTRPSSVVVAGHICLDLIPRLTSDRGRRALRPGALDMIGPMTLAVGGCVGNTGIALGRLGLRTSLVARVGDDPLGSVLRDLVRSAVPPGADHLVVTPGEPTSYSVVFNRRGEDRAIAHFPGVNNAFVADDVPDGLLHDADLLHVGYPPLMAALVADEGRELHRLLGAAHAGGVVTSLDMANPGRDAGTGRVPWRRVLERALPAVDVFLPSLAEACHLLDRRVRPDDRGVPDLGSVANLADELVALGAAIAGVKLGEHGLFLRTAPAERMAAVPLALAPAWTARELYSSVFEADVAGTTGAGDATFAGFLFGLLGGMSPDQAITAACAVGGSSTEAADGTSGVPRWPEIERRLRAGWRRREATPGAGWSQGPVAGLWYGPRDAAPAAR